MSENETKTIEVSTGATSTTSGKNSAEEAVNYINEVKDGKHQDEKLSPCRYRALVNQADHMLEVGAIDQDEYDAIIAHLAAQVRIGRKK